VSASAIERAFGCAVVNHYSSYEVLHVAQTCPDHPALMHVDGERVILRVVREDGHAAAPGESGRIVITDLGNWVMPFINYDTGDWAQAGPPCPCGRGFPTLQSIEGRLGEAIRTPAGKVVSATVLGWFLAHMRGGLPYIWEFQAVQRAPDAVVLRIVPTARFTTEFAAELERALEEFLGPGVRVTVETVERIATEASGKRLVIKSALTPA
jgi:phenylacetate-CoA ligase